MEEPGLGSKVRGELGKKLILEVQFVLELGLRELCTSLSNLE